MSFYYPSIFSFIFLAVLYAVVLGLIWLVWVKLAKRKFSGPAAWGVVALVIVAPWLEEFWIAWNFGQLCRKDAGIVVHKVVEVEGYYDATAGLLQLNKPVLPVTAADFDKRGYRFYEMSLAAANEGQRVAYFEKVNEEWVGTVLDKPTAKYHYTRNIYGENVAHKITRVEARVANVENGEIIGRYVSYGRGPYWFYISLGNPPYSCDGPDGGPNSKHNSLIYRNTLKPISK